MNSLKEGFKEKVLQVVRKIPRGKTLAYKEVACLAGRPRAYRAVGNILNFSVKGGSLPAGRQGVSGGKNIPCHRVIRSDGKIGGYVFGTKRKAELLKKEKASIFGHPMTKN